MEKKLVTIKIRPKDGEWVMGEDYEMTVSYDMSIMNIKKRIEEERGIHHERSNVMHPRAKKFIEKNRESWLGLIGCVFPFFLVIVVFPFAGVFGVTASATRMSW